jgi:hypothetical protein
MWANHTWGVWPAARELYRGRPRGATESQGQALSYDGTLLEIRHTLEDMERVAEYCSERYFREPNYIRIEGKPLFAIWYPLELERQLGGCGGVAAAVQRLQRRARAAGLPGLHIAMNIANLEEGATLCWRPDFIGKFKALGVDSVFGYNVARTPGYAQLPDEKPVVSYDDVIESHRTLFRLCEDRGLPFHPVATAGFDNTPRWHKGACLPLDFRKFFYEPIVVGNTPEKFGALLREALACIRRQPPGYRFLLINAWNEWTEGTYLLPEKRTGTARLRELKKVLEFPGGRGPSAAP